MSNFVMLYASNPIIIYIAYNIIIYTMYEAITLVYLLQLIINNHNVSMLHEYCCVWTSPVIRLMGRYGRDLGLIFIHMCIDPDACFSVFIHMCIDPDASMYSLCACAQRKVMEGESADGGHSWVGSL